MFTKTLKSDLQILSNYLQPFYLVTAISTRFYSKFFAIAAAKATNSSEVNVAF